MMAADAAAAEIEAFIARSRALTGCEVRERAPWNTVASADAIRHFAYGTSDDNPLWLDPAYAAASRHGRLVAPPAFLTSVLYPALHGHPSASTLSSLIGEVEYEWSLPVLEGDALGAASRQTGVFAARDRKGRRLACVLAETTYRNQRDEVVGLGRATMVRMARADGDLVVDRDVTRYRPEEIEAIAAALRAERRSGRAGPAGERVAVGDELPVRVRGPLTIGDLVAWQAAIGPSYRAGALGYRDCREAPHTAVTNPLTGWPVKYSQQHEDQVLSRQRGMPAPFDNGVMRFAWLCPMLTDWMGDDGFLRRLRVQVVEPILYGDTTWYRARVTGVAAGEGGTLVKLAIAGTNQLGATTTTADAEVVLPASVGAGRSNPPAPPAGRGRTRGLRLIHQAVADQAARRPAATAVVGGEEAVTYGELNGRANRLARWLGRRGVGVGSVVAILMERTPEVLVAVLAVLKAGAAYLPLDPAYPQARLRTMLAGAGAGVVLTDDPAVRDLAPAGAAVIVLDAERAAIAREPDGDPAVAPAAADLAYVIYTSGTTGAPRAVVVPHASVAVYLRALARPLAVGAKDVYLHTAALAFSAAVRQALLPLSLGATLVFASEAERTDPRALAALIRRRGVTVWDTVPAMLRSCLEGADLGAGLRQVFVTGEPLAWSVARAFRRRLGARVRLVNLYSQTETAGTVACFAVPARIGADAAGAVPAGRPIARTRAYVLDDDLRPVPAGEAGMLYVGGDRLAAGYVGDAAASAATFVPDPFAGARGGRLCRTGDRARLGAGGVLEILDRADDQVQVRGFRVSVREVASALLACTGVRDAVVTARADAGGERRLIAYVVRDPSAPMPPGGWRRALAAALPPHMLPAAFVSLAALPVGPNGKVDRTALPAPDCDRPETVTRFVAPQDGVEAVLAGWWREILGVARVGADDDFFDLGGHSLLAARVLARIADTWGVEVPLRRLFEEPTVAALARAVAAGRASPTTAAPAPPGCGAAPGPGAEQRIPRLPPGAVARQSFAQERLWFLDRLEPESPLYNLVRAVRITGRLDVAALGRALDAIVARHEILRTAFTAPRGEPVQTPGPPWHVALPVVDLAELPAETRAAALARGLEREVDRPFDLTRDRMLRAVLMRLTDAEHVLLITSHHMVGDGWSRGVLLREIAALQAAFARGEPSPLPELPIQYRDFAAWQRAQLERPAMHAQLAHWKARLTGAPALLDLPADRPRPAVRTFLGARVPFTLPDEVTAALHAAGRRAAATPFMVMLAAFQALLHRYSGDTDLVVGAPVAGRTRVELEPLIGIFVNVLPLRTDLGGDPSFLELLARVRAVVVDALAHQDVPFEKLVEALRPERALSHNPIFQVALVFRPATPVLAENGLTYECLHEIDNTLAKFDLCLHVLGDAGPVAGFLEYSTDLFDAPTAEGIVGHFLRLLADAVRAPERRLSELTLLAPAEERRVLAWSGSGAAAEPPPVLAQIERAAARFPERVAVSAAGEDLSYRALDERAGRLAGGLRALGVGAGDRVAICMERSIDAVVALLAILRAGAAYVPLEPALPPRRLAAVVEDARPAAILTQRHLLPGLPAGGPRALCLDELPAAGGATPPAPAANDLAYLIYTSGSSGAPKGVMVEHRALASFTRAACGTYGLGADDRVLQFAPLCFDASVEEIFPCLAVGATLVLRSDAAIASPRRFLESCRDAAITVASLPTAYWHEVARALPLGGLALPALRLLVIGGEVARPEALARWRAQLGPAPRIVNTYGPTETTVVATAHDLGGADEAGVVPATIPIGRPLPGCEVHVLDGCRRPVPVGVPGELFVGGGGVARGYWNRPALTRALFVAHPFSAAPDARLFRSGDRVRWRADGTLEFLGRADRQVKIRGFRVEPAEIESALARHPAVREAVVAARDAGPRGTTLVAWVAAGGDGIEGGALRRWLRAEVPDYMLPAAVVVLPELPRTPSGKVDPEALPAPAVAPAAAAPAAPRSAVERRLAAIWRDVLGVPRVGIHDSFFDLGGHSLLAVAMFARIEEAFGCRLPLAALFAGPTVADLAALVGDGARGAAAASIVTIRRGAARPPVFFLHSIGGELLYCRELAALLGPRAVHGIQPPRERGAIEASDDVGVMAARYVRDLVAFEPDGPYLLAGHSFAGLVAYEMARQLLAAGRRVGLLALIDSVPYGAIAGGANGRGGAARPHPAPRSAAGGVPLATEHRRVEDLHARAWRRFVPAPYPGRVVLFRAAGRDGARDLTRLWGELAAGGIESHEVPGDHLGLLQEPHVRVLAARLRAALERTA